MKTIAILATLDTKGLEAEFVRGRLQSLEIETCLVDTGCVGEPAVKSDISREAVFAALFATSRWADAFVFAFRIPNLLRDFFAEGALSAAFVPTFTEVREKEGEGVDTTSLSYDRQSARWELVDDLRGGSDAMRDASVKWTPKERGEYQLTLTCRENGSSLETRLNVQDVNRERLGRPARFDVLEEIASITRGTSPQP